jgi:hypothetical protein
MQLASSKSPPNPKAQKYPEMPVTEITLLKLTPSTTVQSQALISFLTKKRASIESHHTSNTLASTTVYFFQQIEDPTCLYSIAQWESVEEHTNDLCEVGVEEEENLEAKKLVEVVWMAHVGFEQPQSGSDGYNLDVDRSDLPSLSLSSILSGAPVISIGRHTVAAERRSSFAETFGHVRHHLDEHVSWKDKPIGGWKKVDHKDSAGGSSADANLNWKDSEEWILICPWKAVEEHQDFAKTPGFGEYRKIAEFVDEFDVKHARRLELNVTL